MKSQKSELKVREREKDGGDSDARRGKGATHPSIFNPVLKHPSFYTKRENPNSTQFVAKKAKMEEYTTQQEVELIF